MKRTLYNKAAMLITALVVCAVAYTQNKNPRQTFLWRISGNGLSKPSFLYGTIHLTDRKLFQFSDSLYHYLEQAEGLNIEIDADTMINASVRSWAQNNNGRLLKSLLSKKEYDRYADKLSKTLGKPADRITTRDLWMAKNKKIATAYKKGDMQTIMDLYLYGIARKQGKTVGGIEDIEDQMEIIDDLFDKTDVAYVTADLSPEPGRVERMKQMYISEDLEGIRLMLAGSSNQKFIDVVLKKRNFKMASRMDSLARQRSSFFAVGVAHLPGDTGVISLLKKKGYAVDPVFSSKKISPEKYSYTVVNRPWIKYTHDLNLYDVEAPGVLQPMDLAKDKMDMKFYYDVTTAKVYYTAVFNFGIDVSNKDSVFSAMINRIAAANRSLVSQKTIFKQNFEGRDVIINTSGNQQIRINVFAAGSHGFMTMILSKASEVNDEDSKRFLESFTINPASSISRPYFIFTDKASAFSIKLPQQPLIADQEDIGTPANNIKTFSARDFTSGNSYAIYAGSVKAGHYIPNDSSYFEQVKANLLPSLKADSAIKRLVYKGYPALQISGSMKTGNQHLKSICVLRGNRTYLLLAQSNGSKEGLVLADSFLHSFVLTDYAGSNWTYQHATDSSFATWLPVPDTNQVEEPASVDSSMALATDSLAGKIDKAEVENDFVYYDKSTGTSYNVGREVSSPYFFTTNDSTLFSEEVAKYKIQGDSIRYFKQVTIDNDKAADVLIENPNSSIVKKIRFILHGDTLYKVFTYTPHWLSSNDNTKLFFDRFKINSKAQVPTIFTNKSSKLISDLASPDSAIFDAASAYLDDAEIRKADLKAFYPLLTTPLRDFKEDAYNTNYSLVNAVSRVADSTTVDFVVQHYKILTSEQLELQYQLLTLLVKMQQPYATESLKKLFNSGEIPGGDVSVFAGSLYGNLQVGKLLAPKILEMTRDTGAALGFAFVIRQLIDSNYLTRQDVVPYLKNFTAAAEAQKKKIQVKASEYPYQLTSVLDLFGTIGNPGTIEKLQEFSTLNNLDVSYTAVSWLIRNKQPLPAKAIVKLASSNAYRSLIYDTLYAVDKAGMFPSSQLYQRSFAASYVYGYAAEDGDQPSGVKYLAEKVALFRGEKQRFYLFDVSFGEGGEASHSLGIAGPFSLKTIPVTSSNEATGFYWEEDYSAKKMNEQFARYLQGLDEDY